MLVKWTKDRMASVPRLSGAESGAEKTEKRGMSTEEELRTHGVASRGVCKNLTMILLALFLVCIFGVLLFAFAMLFLLPIPFILKLKASNLLMVFLNLALLELILWLETVRSLEVVEDYDEVENDEFDFEIEDYEDVENIEFELEEYEEEE